MEFLQPGWLWGMTAVAAAALWALFRPARRRRVVAGLWLWKEALADLPVGRRRRRRITASWILLLLGASAAAVAMARPIIPSRRPVRHVAVGVAPSAELLFSPPELRAEAASAVRAFLDRLDAEDRVCLGRPTQMGGWGEWQTVRDIRAGRTLLRDFLSIPGSELRFPPSPAGAGEIVLFSPVIAHLPAGPGLYRVRLSTQPPALRIVRLAARRADDQIAEMLVTVMNTSDAETRATLRITGRADADALPPRERTLALAPGERENVLLDLPVAQHYAAELLDAAGRRVWAAWLVRPPRRKLRIAWIGRDEPSLRRYLAADEWLEPAAIEQAAVAVVVSAPPPADLPALVVEPTADPPGWRSGSERRNVRLDRANLAGDDPLLADVAWSGVAVRRLQPWLTLDQPGVKPLVSLPDGGAVVLRSVDRMDDSPRRVWVGFDPSLENSNWAMTDGFVIFLANAFRWLGGDAPARDYLCFRPDQVSASADWRPVDQLLPPGGGVESLAPGNLLPGLYKDLRGQTYAVNLLDLQAPRAAEGPGVSEAVETIPLPEPQPLSSPRELWPMLALAAGGLWLVGWSLRIIQ